DQAFGNKEELFQNIQDPDTLAFVKINYGPWDRLNSNKVFIERYGKKPLGANFYPNDIKYLPFISMKFEDKLSMFTLLRRDEAGELYTIPFHKAYAEKLEKAAGLMKQAAELCENLSFKKYLISRADAFLTDDYYESDIAWMEINDNTIDYIVGPIESEDDRFINTKTSYEAFLIVKDHEWSEKLKMYLGSVPELIKNIPIEDKYKDLFVGSASGIGVYDAIYYSGLANSGGKSISINYPKDGRILMEKGNKKLQFKNVMKAKFDKILYPIGEQVIDESQLKHVKFEAFFENNLFYEIADGLKINNTVNNQGSVKDALKDYYNTINAMKADVLRILFLTKLHDMGKFEGKDLMDNYVTFVADIFRSVRFGTSHYQGEGNMVTFNFFLEQGAIVRNNETGKYMIDFDKMKATLEKLANTVLVIQCDGNYEAAQELIKEKGMINEDLKQDLYSISKAGIPRDVIFEQGLEVLGLN
ncbi:MAG: Zn-dependent hydrolase, partial [Bacteroidota bacterium]